MGTPAGPNDDVQHLIQAIKEGRATDVAALVEGHPALAEARDAAGVSALVLALYHGREDIAARLAAPRPSLDVFEAASLGDDVRLDALLRGSPGLVHAVSPDGFTALALASFFGRLAAVRLLLEHGADANAVGEGAARYTPLTGAVTGRHADVVRELLRRGADPTPRYGPGYTPLHVACANGSEEIVRMLLQAGADKNARTDEGKTPRDLASDTGHAVIAAWLA
jgi:ankyrin repeat protein